MQVYIVARVSASQSVHGPPLLEHTLGFFITPASALVKDFKWGLVSHILTIAVNEVGAFIALSDN